MLHKNFIQLPVLLLIFISIIGASQTVSAAPPVTNPDEAMRTAQSLYSTTLDKKTDELLPTVQALDTYLQSSDIDANKKENITKRLVDMGTFLSSTSSPSTTTLMAFLRDTNKVARDFTEYVYSKETYSLPQEIFTMQYGAQRMHIDILGGKLNSARSNGFEEIRDAWTPIRENVDDTIVQQSVDDTLVSLETAFKNKDSRAIYDGGASILALIPQIESSYKEPTKLSALLEKFGRTKTVGVGISLMVFVLVMFIALMKRKRVLIIK